MTAAELRDIVLMLALYSAGWITCWARMRRDNLPATARAIRRAQQRNKADLRKMRGR